MSGSAAQVSVGLGGVAPSDAAYAQLAPSAHCGRTRRAVSYGQQGIAPTRLRHGARDDDIWAAELCSRAPLARPVTFQETAMKTNPTEFALPSRCNGHAAPHSAKQAVARFAARQTVPSKAHP